VSKKKLLEINITLCNRETYSYMFFITGHVVLYMFHIRTLTNIYIYVANQRMVTDKVCFIMY